METAAKDDAGIKDDLLVQTGTGRRLLPDRPYRQRFGGKGTDLDPGLPVRIVKICLVDDLRTGLVTEFGHQLLLGAVKR